LYARIPYLNLAVDVGKITALDFMTDEVETSACNTYQHIWNLFGVTFVRWKIEFQFARTEGIAIFGRRYKFVFGGTTD